MAVGGTQTVTALIDEDGERRAFDHPFDATAKDGVRIASVDAPEVEIVAEAAGTTELRLVDEDTGELFDMVGVSAAEIDSASVAPSGYDGSDSPVFFASGTSQVVVSLRSEAEDALVDEGMELSAAAGADVEGRAWDTFVLENLEVGENSLTITTSAGDSHEEVIEAVDTIDGIDRTLLWDDDEPDSEQRAVELDVDQIISICFAGVYEGDPVVGLDWSYELEGPIALANQDDPGRCAHVHGESAGEGTLTASAEGESLAVQIEVLEPGEAAALADPRSVGFADLLGPTPGHRAAP